MIYGVTLLFSRLSVLVKGYVKILAVVILSLKNLNKAHVSGVVSFSL